MQYKEGAASFDRSLPPWTCSIAREKTRDCTQSLIGGKGKSTAPSRLAHTHTMINDLFDPIPRLLLKRSHSKGRGGRGRERMPIVNNRSARDGRREWGRIRKRGENRPEFKLQRNPAREGGKEEKEIRLAPAGVGMGWRRER